MGKPSHRLEHNAEASEEHGARSERADPNAKPLRAVLSHLSTPLFIMKVGTAWNDRTVSLARAFALIECRSEFKTKADIVCCTYSPFMVSLKCWNIGERELEASRFSSRPHIRYLVVRALLM